MLSTHKSQREGGGACAIAPARPCLFAERKGGVPGKLLMMADVVTPSRAGRPRAMVWSREKAEAASQTHETKEGVKNG